MANFLPIVPVNNLPLSEASLKIGEVENDNSPLSFQLPSAMRVDGGLSPTQRRGRQRRFNQHRRRGSRSSSISSDSAFEESPGAMNLDTGPSLMVPRLVAKGLLLQRDQLDVDVLQHYERATVIDLNRGVTCNKCGIVGVHLSHVKICDFGRCRDCRTFFPMLTEHRKHCVPVSVVAHKKPEFKGGRPAKSNGLVARALLDDLSKARGDLDAKVEALKDVVDECWAFEEGDSELTVFIKLCQPLTYASLCPDFIASVQWLIKSGCVMNYGTRPDIGCGAACFGRFLDAEAPVLSDGFDESAWLQPKLLLTELPVFFVGPPTVAVDDGEVFYYHNEVWTRDHFVFLRANYTVHQLGVNDVLYRRSINPIPDHPILQNRFTVFHPEPSVVQTLVATIHGAPLRSEFTYDSLALKALKSLTVIGPHSLQTSLQHLRDLRYPHFSTFPSLLFGTALFHAVLVSNARCEWVAKARGSVPTVERLVEANNSRFLGCDGTANLVVSSAAAVLGVPLQNNDEMDVRFRAHAGLVSTFTEVCLDHGKRVSTWAVDTLLRHMPKLPVEVLELEVGAGPEVPLRSWSPTTMSRRHKFLDRLSSFVQLTSWLPTDWDVSPTGGSRDWWEYHANRVRCVRLDSIPNLDQGNKFLYVLPGCFLISETNIDRRLQKMFDILGFTYEVDVGNECSTYSNIKYDSEVSESEEK